MLSVANLSAGYGKVEVLHGLSLEVGQGKLVTLIGSNGAGKTTTLRALSGMIKPRAGSVRLGGVEISGLAAFRIARCGLAHSPEGAGSFRPRPLPTISCSVPFQGSRVPGRRMT